MGLLMDFASVPIMVGLIGILIAIYVYYKSPKTKDIRELEKIQAESDEGIRELIGGEAKETREENKLTHKIYLNNLMSIQFNRLLESQKLDKNVLLKELEGNKVETLYIIKQKESGDEKPLRKRIKLLGFKNVSFGDWILPPKKLKDKSFFKEEGGVKKWVEENLVKDIDLEEFVNSVVIINLSNIYDEEKGETNRAKKIIGGILKPADIVPNEKLLSEICKRDKISLIEILQIPFLDSLVDPEHPLIADQIKRLNKEIVEEIKIELDLDNLRITDLSNLTQEKLGSILKSFNIKSFKLVSINILKNVKIIKSYLDQKPIF